MNPRLRFRIALSVALAVLVLSAASAQAVIITATSAAGINNSGGSAGVGTHYHWSPGSEAQVNYSFGEEGRGVAEFDFSGLGIPVASAWLSFRVSGYKDIYYTPTPFQALIGLFGYAGNNVISVSDFQSTSIGGIGSFPTIGLSVGDVLSFDVTALVNLTLGGSLGVLWDPTGFSPQFSAITFDDIRVDASPVPEPTTLALLGAGLVAVGARRRRRAV